MITYKICIRDDFQRKDGLSLVYCRVTINRKHKKYSLDIKVPSKYFEPDKQCVKNQYPEANSLNVIIDNFRQRCSKIIYTLQLEQQEISFESFEALMFKNSENGDFLSFMEQYIKDNAHKWGEGTIHLYHGEVSKIKKFREKIPFQSLDKGFPAAYEYYMRTTLLNKPNTVIKTFKKLKAVIRAAIEMKLMEKSPFEGYRVAGEPTSRCFLSLTEVDRLERFKQENCDQRLDGVITYFLFACYTGLRYADIKALTWASFAEKHIEVIQEKTGEQILIPISSRAEKLIGQKGKPWEKVFRVLSDQKTNEYLKAIAVRAEIYKNLTFHVARHSFATISLNIGIPLDVVSKLLGHNSIKTTQVYARLMDTTKFEQMQKWDKLPKC